MNFLRIIGFLRYWFAARNLGCESLTVILNFTDGKEAVAFDAAMDAQLNNETILEPYMRCSVSEMEIYGIRVRIESRVHTP